MALAAADLAPPAPGSTPGSRGLVWVLAALAALPAVVATATSIGVDWTPATDYAPIEVRVRDVFSAHPPLVGAFSRVGGNHPGPALFYVLAVPYRLLGSQPWALFVGAGLVNAACIALATRIAGRGGRVGLAAGLAALTVTCVWTLGADHVRDPWNPSMALLPFLLASIATWAVTDGSRASLPVALAAASFCLQAHVGYIFLAPVLAGWCVLGVWLHRADWRSWRIPALLSLVLLTAMWAPVLAQQLFGAGPGNLTHIVAAARDTADPAYGLSGIDDLLLPHLGLTPNWFHPDHDDPLQLLGRRGLTWPPLGLVAFLVGTVVAGRRRDRSPLFLLAITASLWGAGALSISRVSGLPAPYLYLWMRVLGILLWLAAVWPLGRAAIDWARPVVAARAGARVLGRVPVTAAALAVVAMLSVAVSAGEAAAPFRRYRERSTQTAVLSDQALAAVRRQARPGSRVEVSYTAANVFVMPAVVAELERTGFATLVDPANVWGRERRVGSGPADLRLVLAHDLDAARRMDPDLRLAATVPMLTSAEREEYESLAPLAPLCTRIERTPLTDAERRGPDEDREACARRAVLARNDRTVWVLLGPTGD